MEPRLQAVFEALERPHRLGMIGGDLEEQLAHCASFSLVIAKLFGATAPIAALDLGTGGGVPGLPLAYDWDKTKWTLVDMREGRSAEVERAALGLGLKDRVTVLKVRAQELAHQPEYREVANLVVARAFGPPSLTAECASGLLGLGGTLIVSEPPVENTERWPEQGLTACGFSKPIGHVFGGHHFVSLTKSHRPDGGLPRLPAKRDRGWP